MITKKSWREEARKRCEAATVGPYAIVSDGTGIGISTTQTKSLESGLLACMQDPPDYCARPRQESEHRANAAFFAHARTDLPRALDLLDEKDAQIAVWKDAIRKHRKKKGKMGNGPDHELWLLIGEGVLAKFSKEKPK